MNKKLVSILTIAAFLLCGCNNSNDNKTPKHTNYYLVSYLANGGVGSTHSESIKENTLYTVKDCLFTPPSGKVFNNWLIDNVSYNPGDKIKIVKDTDILATYKDEGSTEVNYTVSFNPGLGTGFMEPYVVEEGYSITLPACTFTPPLGYSFYRWADDVTTYKVGATVTINEDTMFTAYYVENGHSIYTVTFNANGGSGTMDPVQVEEGLYNLPTCTFTAPSGKTFDYWSISTGTTHYQPDQPINVQSNVTVTANWKNITPNRYTITYNANGGSGSMSSRTEDENTWIYLATCTFTVPTNKEFDCWTINSQQYDEGQAYKLTSNVTAYATWKNKEEDDPPAEWQDDKYYLSDIGYYNMGIPSNKNNPVEIRTTLSADSSSWFNTKFEGDVANGYRYIYRNSCSDGPSGHYTSVDTYSISHDGGGLQIANPGSGFGSPYFNHSGAKLELRIGLSSVNNATSGTKDPNKDTYHIYFFGENNEYLGKSIVARGTITDSTKELQIYYKESNAINVKYFEFRCIAKPYDSKKLYNVGIGSCNIKSWERV